MLSTIVLILWTIVDKFAGANFSPLVNLIHMPKEPFSLRKVLATKFLYSYHIT
jgi:hypothetical protein